MSVSSFIPSSRALENDSGSAGGQLEYSLQPPLQSQKYDLKHLNHEDLVFGPLQDDEALALYGLVKVIRPKTLVQFGHLYGDSARNFLRALDHDAHFYSFDINPAPAEEFSTDPRFHFRQKDQTLFEQSDVDFRTIDFAFLDAGHTFEIQEALFGRIQPALAPDAILVVHDTGLHIPWGAPPGPIVCDFFAKCGHIHQPGERVFINWIQDTFPDWQVVTLQSFEVVRHGISVLQRRMRLSTESIGIMSDDEVRNLLKERRGGV